MSNCAQGSRSLCMNLHSTKRFDYGFIISDLLSGVFKRGFKVKRTMTNSACRCDVSPRHVAASCRLVCTNRGLLRNSDQAIVGYPWPYRCFSITLKVILFLSDHYKLLNRVWLWIEVCQNAVFSKIDITMTTIINKKLWNR